MFGKCFRIALGSLAYLFVKKLRRIEKKTAHSTYVSFQPTADE